MSAQSRLHARFRRRVRTPLHGLVVAAVVFGGVAIAAPAQAAPSAPSGPADATSAADASSAAVIAARYHHPVTDLSSLTETTTAAAQPDGTTQVTISTAPVRVRRGNGWADVSTKLAKGPDGMLAPAAVPTPVEFSPGGGGALARVKTANGSWMSVAAPVPSLPAPTVDGASATYAEVLPGVDLRVTATDAGMSEVLVIKSAAAAANPKLAVLQFGITGARVVAGAADSAAKASAPDGSVLVSPTPTWWDSSGGGTADRPGGAGLTRPAKATVTDTGVGIDAADAASTPGVTYPVYVDPDWTGGEEAWTFVDSRYPNSSYWLGSNHGTDNEAHSGYIDAAHCGCSDGAHLDRSYWQIDTTGIQGKHVLSAHFNTSEISSSACTTNQFDLNEYTPISSATTWNAQPQWWSYLSSANLGPQRSGCASQYGVGFDATAAAVESAQKSWIYITLELNAHNEGDYTTWRRFNHAATMTVTYNTPPSTPWAPWNNSSPCTTTAPGPIYHDSAVSPVPVAVTTSDPDGGNVGVIFNVAHYGGANALDPAVYPNGWIDAGMHAAGAFQVNVPTNLPDGAYQWNSRAYDGIDWSPGYSAMCYFQVKNTPPGAPVVTPSATTGLTVGAPMTMTLGPKSASDGVVGYAWTWGPSANAPTYAQMPACGGETSLGGIHYVCGSSLTLTVSPESAPAPAFTVWAFDGAGNRSAATVTPLSAVAQDPTALAASAHQWTTDLSGLVPASQCASGATTVSCIADNNVPDVSQPNGQWPIAIPSGVTVRDSTAPATGTVSFVAGATAENPGMNTVSLTVPAGVTSADLGVVTVATADGGQASGATLPGWTIRDDQGNPAGEPTSSSYIFTRLGGQQAGDVLTVTLPGNTGATIAAAWYDTGGRDVQAVGALWDTNATNMTTVSWPAASYSGTADVLLVAASRTAGGPTIGTPAGATLDYQQIITTKWNAGGVFGHAQGVSPTTFSATWNGGIASHNVNALQLVLAGGSSPVAPGGPVGVLNFASTANAPMIGSSGVVVDTSKSFTVGAWITPTQQTGHYETALSEQGVTNSGFFLQLTDTWQWKFTACSTTTNSCGAAIAPGTASPNQPVYASGVYDAINHEARLYLNGSSTPAAVANFWRDSSPSASGGLTIGSAWWNSAFADPFVGQIGNPVVLQGVLTPDQIAQLKNETFFVSNLG